MLRLVIVSAVFSTGCHVVSGLDDFGARAGDAATSAGGGNASGTGGMHAAGGGPGGGEGGGTAIALPGCRVGPQEDFSAAGIPMAWAEWQEPNGSDPPVTLGFGGVMEVKLPNELDDGSVSRGIFSRFQPPSGDAAGNLSDCAFVVEWVQVPADLGMFAAMGTDHTQPGGPEERLYLRVIDGEVVASVVASSGNVDSPGTPYRPNEHRWLAILGEAGHVVFASSPDGRNWFELWRQNLRFTPNVRSVNLGAGAWEPVGGTVIFDNVNRAPQ